MRKAVLLFTFWFPLILMGQSVQNQGQEAGNAALEYYEQQTPVVPQNSPSLLNPSKKELKQQLRTLIKKSFQKSRGRSGKPLTFSCFPTPHSYPEVPHCKRGQKPKGRVRNPEIPEDIQLVDKKKVGFGLFGPMSPDNPTLHLFDLYTPQTR